MSAPSLNLSPYSVVETKQTPHNWSGYEIMRGDKAVYVMSGDNAGEANLLAALFNDAYRRGAEDSASKWLPMDSAPKDGSRILVNGYHGVYIAQWADVNDRSSFACHMTWCVAHAERDYETNQRMTVANSSGWMPLPS